MDVQDHCIDAVRNVWRLIREAIVNISLATQLKSAPAMKAALHDARFL
jgi:hypothetical protein